MTSRYRNQVVRPRDHDRRRRQKLANRNRLDNLSRRGISRLAGAKPKR
jgi:hypothetical protein